MAENHGAVVSTCTPNLPNTALHSSIPVCSTCSFAFPCTVGLSLPTVYLSSRWDTTFVLFLPCLYFTTIFCLCEYSILFCADSLYACESIFTLCRKYRWSFLIRYKKGSIPSVYQEYESLRKQEKNYEEFQNNGSHCWYDHVNGIDYNGCPINLLEYGESGEKHFCFLTNLPITLKNRIQLLRDGRRRWAIENQGFNAQKNHGFYLEHLFSRNGQAMKNHYLLIQIGHMISQLLDAWSILWEDISIRHEQKHRCLLESWKHSRLLDFPGLDAPFQIRFL